MKWRCQHVALTSKEARVDPVNKAASLQEGSWLKKRFKRTCPIERCAPKHSDATNYSKSGHDFMDPSNTANSHSPTPIWTVRTRSHDQCELNILYKNGKKRRRGRHKQWVCEKMTGSPAVCWYYRYCSVGNRSTLAKKIVSITAAGSMWFQSIRKMCSFYNINKSGTI